MKRIILLILALMTATVPSAAQITHTANGNVDANAQRILTKAAQKMNSGCVSFQVTMINLDSDKKTSASQKAQVLFNKGRYRVSTDELTIYCDNKTVWSYNKTAKEVTINNVSSSDDDLMNPAKLLSNYSKNYKAKFIRTESDGTSVVDLTPKKRKSYYKVRLLVSEAGLLNRLELFNYDGTGGQFKVSNFKTGVKCSDSDFVFNSSANKNIEVIDMR